MKKTVLQVFTYAIVAFFAREAFLFYRIYTKVTHQAPSTFEIIKQNGYPAEEHKVKTNDGYILTIFRIPAGKSDQPTPGPKPVVLLQHGTFSCSNAFVSIGPKSLGFLLADRGYDVWLGNLRGNRYAMEHTTHESSDPIFWDFSGDEVALHDIPATVDYILKCTNKKKLSYVGHSLGASIIFGILSKSPEYNDKVATVIALAPGCPGGVPRNNPVYLSMFIFAPSIMKTGHGPYPVVANEFADYSHPYCAPHLFFSFICESFYSLGGPTTHVNRANLPLIIGSFSSTSRKLVVHLARTITREKYHLWNSESEEDYPLHLVSTPVVIFYSDGDYIISPKTVQNMNKILPNVTSIHKVPANSFNHLDFLFGETAEELVYKEIFNTLEKYHLATSDTGNTTIKEKDPVKN